MRTIDELNVPKKLEDKESIISKAADYVVEAQTNGYREPTDEELLGLLLLGLDALTVYIVPELLMSGKLESLDSLDKDTPYEYYKKLMCYIDKSNKQTIDILMAAATAKVLKGD